jgi:hypothetical protein
VTARLIPSRLLDALPVFLVLAAWAAIGIKRRLQQAADIQKELDRITGVSPLEEWKE